jgi:predicted amidohydrolase YtcJ
MLEALRSLNLKDELRGRIYVMLDWTDENLLEYFFSNGPDIDPDNFLTVRCIKIFVDGALGSRGAAMMEPYSDAPGEKGLVVTPEDEVIRLVSRALKSGFQVAVHAIGDRANRITLNAYRKATAAAAETSDHRLRLEHAQVVALEDIPQFAPLGVVLSMQPPHCISDMGWAEERVGPERIQGAYAWRSFLDTGVHMTLNSDFPGESLDPFFGMYCAMTRQTPEGKPAGGWYPDQRLSRDEALKAYTVEAAYSGFEEGFKGKIYPGYLADFIVLSNDILTIPVSSFLSLRVEKTYISGNLVFTRMD